MAVTSDAVVRNGKVETEESLPAPDGTRVLVIVPDEAIAGVQPLTLRPGEGQEGIPPIPGPEELARNAARLQEVFAHWTEEGPSGDLATWEELEAGLAQHPLQIGEVRLDE